MPTKHTHYSEEPVPVDQVLDMTIRDLLLGMVDEGLMLRAASYEFQSDRGPRPMVIAIGLHTAATALTHAIRELEIK